MNQRRRAIVTAGVVIALVWAVAWLGRSWARHSRMTAEKFQRHVQSLDLAKLQGTERTDALQGLAERLNQLPYEERRRVRFNQDWQGWFNQMTETEKEQFVEATFPTGVKQMLTAFEKMPDERRRRIIDEALRRLREAPEAGGGGPLGAAGQHGSTLAPPEISPELEARIRNVGLRAFIANSSAKTKAEVAPLLEEIQRILESGGRIRGRR